MKKPIKRSKLRIAAGKAVFKVLRYYDWYFGEKQYAVERNSKSLPYSVFQHQTPLIRQLRNVDLWLQYNKIENLRLASKRINGFLLRPGETFSYWRLIGKATRRKGYKKGMVLHQGSFKPGIGGGLCQLSNLIYWMTLHTDLLVTERYRHSYDVFPDSGRTQPFGSGATCIYNYRDLQIYNGTDRTYQLLVSVEDEYLTGQWRADTSQESKYEVYERNHRMESTFWGAYIRSNELYRKVYNAVGENNGDEFITRNEAYMMYQPFLEGQMTGSTS